MSVPATAMQQERPGPLRRLAHVPVVDLVYLAVLFFCLFPYVQLVPLSSYTQPYGFLMAAVLAMLWPGTIPGLPKLDLVLLVYIAALGCVMFSIEFVGTLDMREASFLLSYLTPLVTTAACYAFLRRSPELVRKCVIYAIFAWLGVSVLQYLISPTFLTFLITSNSELGSDIVASGRGVIGLAPEPTHAAFHIILLGAVVAFLGGPLWVTLMALCSTLLVYRSASAILVFAIALLIWGGLRPFWRSWVLGAVVLAALIARPLAQLLGDSTRIGSLMGQLSEGGLGLLVADYSTNIRLAGMFMPIYHAFENYLMPQGISIERWGEIRSEILSQYSWIMDLSFAGPATGWGLFIVQGGFLGVPFVIYGAYRFFGLRGVVLSYLAVACFVVFMNQFYVSTPAFGLVLAAILYSGSRDRSVAAGDNQPPAGNNS
ncbi:hypothetical protein [Hoeflea ulvae]|uniref:Uncharacterized protein n=1 Tax=Hoeflea ulvae TaxID=2983764 RepID=A0ABT3YAX4_9HYPH|nr:hypothetical protein [Hoeflea ulvae]MCY0093035.1 hypothetical protein [Hoeflea ulvae]